MAQLWFDLDVTRLLEFAAGDDIMDPTPSVETDLKRTYLRKAIQGYEYSPAPEYDKVRMTPLATTQGTLDFGSYDDVSVVELCLDGAWVNARVWVPKQWIQTG